MRIDIKQRMGVNDQYSVLMDGEETYFAMKQSYTVMPTMYLYRQEETKPRWVLKRQWMPFIPKYRIEFPGKGTVQFKTLSVWRLHYQCKAGIDTYDIYGHIERKYSVFKNNRQIAWWSTKAVIIFDADHYTMVADNDADYELLIAFCLILDNFYRTSPDPLRNLVNYRMSTFWPTEKEFDPSWQPA